MNFSTVLAALGLVLLIALLGTYFTRYALNKSTIITINQMADGTTCYMATATDGVALSCLKQ